MLGDLPRTPSRGRVSVTRRTVRRVVSLALSALLLVALPLPAADDRPEGGDAVSVPARRALGEMRRLADCLAAPTDDLVRELVFHGRPSIEIRGRERGGPASGTVRDLAVVDQAAGRVLSYVCIANASTRASGEAIVSLAVASSRCDKLARAMFPGSKLELESIERRRTGGPESVYYEARYASVSGEFPFLEPPVRLLLNATTGSLFRLELDPDWLEPSDPPRVRISRKAAERIATVVLRGRDLAPAFGAGSVFGKVAGAELFTVRPNENLGVFAGNAEARARVAWVVPFRVDGGDAPGLHSLFVDAATGRILGGALSQSAGQTPP